MLHPGLAGGVIHGGENTEEAGGRAPERHKAEGERDGEEQLVSEMTEIEPGVEKSLVSAPSRVGSFCL